MAKKKKHTLIGHVEFLKSNLEWAWENKWIFGVIALIWTSVIGSCIKFVFIPVATPVVIPIIKNQWEIMVAPYDSLAEDHHERIEQLEDEHGFLEAD